MSNTVLSLKKEGSTRKMLILCVIAIFLVFCSVNVYAQQVKTKVDPEKWKKLTPEQKEKFKEMAKKARDTGLEAAKANEEVVEKAKDAAGTVARYTTAVTIGAVTGGPVRALEAAVATGIAEYTLDKVKKEKEKKKKENK